MSDRIAAFIVGEGNWLPIAMAVALATVIVEWRRHARFAVRDRVMEAMNLFVGVTLLVMGIGHLLAVTAKLWQGSLNGSPALLYPIGVAIVIPSALIVLYANRANAAALNGWMAVTLVVLGLINIPLAIPPVLNIAYRRHSRAGTGRAIVVAFMLVNLGLFAGGMLFLLSGARTFEEFRGAVSLTTTVAAQELPPAPATVGDPLSGDAAGHPTGRHAVRRSAHVVLSRGIDRSPDREHSHAAVAKLSTRSRHRVVAGAGHEIHLFDPPAVIAAVREVIQLYNAK